MYNVGNPNRQNNCRNCQKIEPQSALFEGREKSRTKLQTNRIDKEYQPEVLYKTRNEGIDFQTEMSENYSDKQNPCYSQADAEYFDFAENDAHRDCESDQND